jgi:hypothetical protein
VQIYMKAPAARDLAFDRPQDLAERVDIDWRVIALLSEGSNREAELLVGAYESLDAHARALVCGGRSDPDPGLLTRCPLRATSRPGLLGLTRRLAQSWPRSELPRTVPIPGFRF